MTKYKIQSHVLLWRSNPLQQPRLGCSSVERHPSRQWWALWGFLSVSPLGKVLCRSKCITVVLTANHLSKASFMKCTSEIQHSILISSVLLLPIHFCMSWQCLEVQWTVTRCILSCPVIAVLFVIQTVRKVYKKYLLSLQFLVTTPSEIAVITLQAIQFLI